MACTYYTPEEQRQQAHAELDRLTRLLCEAARLLEKSDAASVMSRELREWLDEHKRHDELREAREREIAEARELRERALAKLTPAERRAIKG